MTSPKSAKKDFSNAAGEWKGGHCGVHSPATVVAKTQSEWKQLWDTTFSNTYPAPKAPKLPKGKMAVGIFTGQRSAPSELSVTGVEEANGAMVVKWKQESFNSMLAVMHEPFILKFIDKTDNAVSFVKEQPKPATPAINLKDLKVIKRDPK